MVEDITTITLSKATRNKLEALKIHPNQSYDELLQHLIKQVNA